VPTTPGLLSTYILQCQRLAKDTTGQFFSTQEWTDYINDARMRLVRDTGCLRNLLNSYVQAATESYYFGGLSGIGITAGGSNYTAPTVSFSGGGGTGAAATLTISGGVITGATVTTPGVGYTTPPSYLIADSTGSGATLGIGIVPQQAFDVMNINIIWGNSRIGLDYLPWSRFNYQVRGWILLQGRPIVFSVFSPGGGPPTGGVSTGRFMLGPPPDQNYACELDYVYQPYYFTGPTDTTIDNIPYTYQSAIQFYACFLALQKMQQTTEAMWFYKMYKMQVTSANNSSYTRRISRAI